MKVLVVLAQPPALEGNAPGRGAVGLLRGLLIHGLDIRVVAPRYAHAANGAVPADLPVEIVDVPMIGQTTRTQLERLRYPRGSLLRPLAQCVRELSSGVDVVHFDETETAWCNAGVSRPASLHIHFRTLRDRPVPPPWRHEFRFVAEYVAAEVVASRRYRFLVANSIEVGKSLRRLNRQATVTVAPFSLEPSHYPPAPVDGPPCAGIIGAGYWPPTATSIDRLVRRVWPKVHRAVPAARLLIAGRDTARLSRVSPAPPGVEYLGEVDAAAAFLSQLSLLLYPATRGSGVKVKVLEAMACAVPVVTTPSGAEGVAANAGIIICDSDEELAATAVRLLQDVHERRERGAEGRAVFLRDHSPGPATVPLVELFRHMAESAA